MNRKLTFNNFDLHLYAGQEDSVEAGIYFLSVQQSQAGETKEPVRAKIDLEQPFIQDALIGLEYRTITKQALQDFGIQLSQWLLPAGPIRNLYQESIGIARDQRLRLRLRISPPELSALPWEYMYDESIQDFFVLNPNTALVRYHNQPIPSIKMVRQPPMAILILMSEPKEVNALPYSHSELFNLLQSLKNLREEKSLRIDILYGGTSREDIQKEILQQRGVRLLDENLSIDTLHNVLHGDVYHVIHYIGHSLFDEKQGGVLFFTDNRNKATLVGAERLERVMRGSNTSAVVLNACQSAKDGSTQSYMGLAPRLIQAGIPAVVAMQYNIPDQAAMDFSNAFYQSLANGHTLDSAVVAGRITLTSLTQDNFSIDWGIPALFMRSSDGMLVEIENQSDKIQTNLQQLSQQVGPSANDTQPRVLVNGIHRHLDYLKSESIQDSKGGPYRGLLTYRLGDGDIFFGRKWDVDRLLSHLDFSHLTILHSESGAGKSSLLHAGLAPRLIAQKHLPIHVRAYNLSPTQALKNILVKNVKQEADLFAEPLRDFLYRICDTLEPDTGLYIILDQFEEFFLLLDEATQSDFIHELADCLEDRTLNVYWIISLRREYFGELANFQPRITQPFANQHYLKRMSREQAYMVIEKPATRYNIYFEQGLIQHLVDDLNQASGEISQTQQEEGVVPSQLQLVCLALYEELEPGQDIIDYALYEKLGGVAGILQNHLENVLRRGLPADQRGTARFLLEALITSQTRRVIRTQTELATELGLHGIDDITFNQVINQMVTQRLLRVTDSYEGTEPAYELAHDYLIHEIELSEEVKERKKAQELLESEVLSWRASQTLISPQRLRIINKQRSLLYFDDLAAELLARSALEANQSIDIWFQVASPDSIRKILLEYLNHEDSTVRANAVAYLTPYFDEDIEQKLIHVAANDSSLDVHKAALAVLAHFCSSSTLQIALDDLQHDDSGIRYHAILALQKFYETDGWKEMESAESESIHQKLYVDLEVQQALFISATTDTDTSTWKQALVALDEQEIELSGSQSSQVIENKGILDYIRTLISSLSYESATEQYWSPLLKAPLDRRSAIYREFSRTIEVSRPIKYRLLLAHVRHLAYTRIQNHPFLAAFFSLCIIFFLFFSGNKFYNQSLDSKWERYRGDTSLEQLETIETSEDQIFVGTYTHGLAWFRNNSWETDFREGFPECIPESTGQFVGTNRCAIFSMAWSAGKTPSEEFYVLTKDDVYRYENQQWIPLQPEKSEDRLVRPGDPACLAGSGSDLSICKSLAVHDNTLLVLSKEDTGIWASPDRGETWSNLKEEEELLAQKLSAVIFDDTGMPYVGGKGGLYRGLGDYPWIWENLNIGRAVKDIEIGLDGRLYLTTITLDAVEANQIPKIGCYQTDSVTDFAPKFLPVANPLMNAFIPIGVEDIEPHPSDPEIFYIVDNFAAVYEMNCSGGQRRIGQKSIREVPTSNLAIWKDISSNESYLLWANYSGLYQYMIPISDDSQ